MLGVSAFDAAAFCEWIDRRLPSWDEWLTAATGGGARTWPWRGTDEPDPERVNVFFVQPDPAPDVAITPQVEDTIDEVVGIDQVTVEQLAELAPWLSEREAELLVQDWPDMGENERGDRLVQLLLQVGEQPVVDELDVLAVDALPDGATPDDPPIHHLLGNAGEWTSTVAGCDGSDSDCIWDGRSRVSLLTSSSVAGDSLPPSARLCLLCISRRDTRLASRYIPTRCGDRIFVRRSTIRLAIEPIELKRVRAAKHASVSCCGVMLRGMKVASP